MINRNKLFLPISVLMAMGSAHAQDKLSHPAISLPPDFRIDEIKPIPGRPPAPTPPLGVLSNFIGAFAGTGLNLIFRPNSAAPTTTTFPTPVSPAPPQPPNENVLELNLTKETLSFSSQLGNVPNRGLEAQNDIFLNGVPYLQTISDVSNPATGRGDGTPTPIHFEPGLWMNIPATTKTPVLANSLVRMASIPHGTTINAQGLAPTTTTTNPAPCVPAVGLAPTTTFNGPPCIPKVSITPFPIGNPANPFKFKSQTAANQDTARIPQDLTKFIAAGTITQAILDDPNEMLREAIKGQNITKTTVFTVSTAPSAPEFGGGAANIAFLEGNLQATNPNANAAQMTATFWIETVEHKIVVPVHKPGQPPLKIAAAAKPGQIAPVFHVDPPREITAPITITVTSPQIQYSQVVFLNFATLTWPHVSVATLVPTTEQPVPPTAWQ